MKLDYIKRYEKNLEGKPPLRNTYKKTPYYYRRVCFDQNSKTIEVSPDDMTLYSKVYFRQAVRDYKDGTISNIAVNKLFSVAYDCLGGMKPLKFGDNCIPATEYTTYQTFFKHEFIKLLYWYNEEAETTVDLANLAAWSRGKAIAKVYRELKKDNKYDLLTDYPELMYYLVGDGDEDNEESC